VHREILELFRSAETSPDSSGQLFAALYGELHQLAERQLRARAGDLTLSTTTLLHEAYLDIAGRDGIHFPDRARFMGYAARAMRGIVIDHARRAHAGKRGGLLREVTLGVGDLEPPDPRGIGRAAMLEELSVALDDLARLEPALAELVDLHFFCGFSLVEIAELRGVCDRTVQRDWRKARLLLHQALHVGEEGVRAPGGAGQASARATVTAR
jgi:RNA polymerase sigma factor (TIGR02999 family)